MSSTGKSTGPHLPYKGKKNGVPRDPTFQPDENGSKLDFQE
jgi:hypothetical protein